MSAANDPGKAAEAQLRPPPQQTIRARFDAENFALRVHPKAVALWPGARIVWEISHLPLGFYPLIHFDGLRAYGPFRAFSQLSQTLVAELPLDTPPGQYSYQLMIRSRHGNSLEAGHATITSPDLLLEVPPPAKAMVVDPLRVTVLPAGSASELEVKPELVVLGNSNAQLAFFFDRRILADDLGQLQPRIEFTRLETRDGKTLKAPPLGPFSALAFDDNVIWGSGDAGLRGRYFYRTVALRESTGELVWASSTDPVIDDEREPP